jgi:hypothetical protein
MAFVIPMVVALGTDSPRAQIFSPSVLHDLGNLLLGFIMLWAYFSFSQFLIIWAGNLPEETPWYLSRLRGGWEWLGVALIVFHFALPLAALLSRDRNVTAAAYRHRRRCARDPIRDLYWLHAVFASADLFHCRHRRFVGVGGIWLSTYLWCLQGRALLPQNDPAFVLAEGD